MSCHVCAKSGEKTCNPQDAEIKCLICGYCERQALAEQFKEMHGE